MSTDPLLDALATLDPASPPTALDERTRRAAARLAGRSNRRWLGLALGLIVALACLAYLVVVLGRASALLG